MFFKKKKTSVSASIASDYQPDMDMAKDTLASVIRILAEFALPTLEVPSDEFSKKCEQLALEILIKAQTGEGGGSARNSQNAYKEVRQLVRQQRKAESSEYSAHRESAHIIVSGLVSNLRKSLVKKGGHDQEIISLLSEMEQVVDKGDLATIRRVTAKTSQRINEVIASERSQEKVQLATIAKQLQVMREELQEAQTQAQRDPLTELLNRRTFDESLKETVELCHALGSELTLYMMDLDFFKKINDVHGHPTGDDVLKKVSRQLVKSFPRKSDMVARYGGEEFAALCQDVGGDNADMLGNRARNAIEQLEIKAEDALVPTTISIGYAVLRVNEDPTDFLRRADEALYEAKETGRNRVEASV